MVLIASLWSILWMCRLTTIPFSASMKSASIRSESSGAAICKKETAPNFPPIWNIRPSPKRKEDGAIKSLTERPLAGSHSHAKLKRSPSGWNSPCSTSRRCFPSSTRAAAPITLKWLRVSVSIRASRARADLISFASMVKVRNFVLISPLLPRSSCVLSISVYSALILSKSSFCGAIVILLLKSSLFAWRLIRESCTPIEASKELYISQRASKMAVLSSGCAS